MPVQNAPVIDSRAGFVAALRWGFAQAFARDARRIVCVDPDFADWPLGEPALLESMSQWLRRPQRQWLLLGAGFDEVPRRHPRFVSWRRSWSHAVFAWQAPEDSCASLPTLLLDDGPLLVHLVDRVHWRGRVGLDARESRPYRDETDAVLQRSTQTLPATQLGL